MKKLILFILFISCGVLSFTRGAFSFGTHAPRVDQALFESMQERLTQEALRARRLLQSTQDKEKSLTDEILARDSEIGSLKSKLEKSEEESKSLLAYIEELDAQTKKVGLSSKDRFQAARELTDMKRSIEQKNDEAQALREQLAITMKENNAMKVQLAQAAKSLEIGQQQVANRETLAQELQAKVQELDVTVSNCESSLESERGKFSKVSAVEKDLVDVRNELLMCKTELSSVSTDAVARLDAAKISQKASQTSQALNKANVSPATVPVSAQVAMPSKAVSRQPGSPIIIEVVADKANLRTGPGSENGILMDIPRGARLAVEEQRGEWYRVLAPTGERAYVHNKVVRVVGNERPSGSSTPTTAELGAPSYEGAPSNAENTAVRARLQDPQAANSAKARSPMVVTPDRDLESFGDVDSGNIPPLTGNSETGDVDSAALANIRRALGASR